MRVGGGLLSVRLWVRGCEGVRRGTLSSVGSEPPGEVRDRLHDVLLSRIGWGWVRVRERLVVGVRGGVWRRGCVLGACMCCE